MIDGRGDPNTSPTYASAVAAMFGLAYKAKFVSKRDLGRDFVVMPLEALWSADDYAAFTSARDKSKWDWTLMILQPDWIEAEYVDAGRDAVAAKAGDDAHVVRLERFDEGLSVQTLHIGPYDAEGPVLARLHDEFVPTNGLRLAGRHHEIYLGDVRRTAPEKLRTILRQPVQRTE